MAAANQLISAKEIAKLFLRLGATAFGGPAAHTGIMHNEVVKHRNWLTDEQFLDLVSATNLIPGPNSTEMAMHIGYQKAGWRGLIVGGISFMLPAVAMVLILSWMYVRFGNTPEIGWLLYGIKPVVIAIIAQALWSLGRKAVKNALLAAVCLAVVVSYFLGINEILLLFTGGGTVVLLANRKKSAWNPFAGFLIPFGSTAALTQVVVPFSLSMLFVTLLKIGAVWYGSGYVLVAFLRADLVDRLGWITDQQLLDAIAVGQITPGPIFTAATFIGYILNGWSGATLATLAICLPSFLFVAISSSFIPRLRKSKIVASLLDGVNVASFALMAAVTWQLGRASLIDLYTMAIAAATLFVLIRFKTNSLWLILGGAMVGLVRAALL